MTPTAFDGEVLVVGQHEDGGFFRRERWYCKTRSCVILAVSCRGQQCEQEGGELTNWGYFEPPGELQAPAGLLVAHGAVIQPLIEVVHDVDLQTGSDLLTVVVVERIRSTLLRRGTDGRARDDKHYINWKRSVGN